MHKMRHKLYSPMMCATCHAKYYSEPFYLTLNVCLICAPHTWWGPHPVNHQVKYNAHLTVLQPPQSKFMATPMAGDPWAFTARPMARPRLCLDKASTSLKYAVLLCLLDVPNTQNTVHSTDTNSSFDFRDLQITSRAVQSADPFHP